MDNKDTNSQSQANDPLKWKSLGFFSAEDYLVYIFKKTEKITAALYLVSGLLKDDEPIKWELRDKGIDLLSSSFTVSSSSPMDKSSVIQSLFTAALETLSLLNVARISNLISDMNHKILVREIDMVVSMLKDKLVQNAENAGYVLSETFFRTPDLFSSGFRSDSKNPSKGHDFRNKEMSDRGVTGLSAVSGGIEGHVSVQLKKTQRQTAIISALKERADLTIKDFSKIIRDCSEKTIQRELIELVEKGLVVRMGERRWSRYSLK